MNKVTLAILGASALFASQAGAAIAIPGVVADSDPANDTAAGADAIVVDAGGSASGLSDLVAGGDVDFYTIDLTAGDVVIISTTPFEDLGVFTVPDTLVGMFDAGMTLLASDDNSGVGAGSFLQFLATATATYTVAVTGAADTGFTGAHSEDGGYFMKVSVVTPAPGAAALAGLGLMVGARRRRTA